MKFIVKLSQNYVSNEAVGKFFILFDYYKITNWLYFDASVNNLNKKEYVFYVTFRFALFMRKRKRKMKIKAEKNLIIKGKKKHKNNCSFEFTDEYTDTKCAAI